MGEEAAASAPFPLSVTGPDPRRSPLRYPAAVNVDRRVHELLSAGDERGAATEAITGLGPDVLRYLRAILRDEEDAADAFSQFAENLWAAIGSFQGRSSLKTWALRIASNAAFNLRQDAFRRRGRRLATGEASALAAEVRTSSLAKDERHRQALHELRRTLTRGEQTLLALRIDQGLSWEETAEVLAEMGPRVSPAALMKRFERLKARLARAARDRGLLE
jgi:RNA polymerase sigma-70 factor (ECF subfamily)